MSFLLIHNQFKGTNTMKKILLFLSLSLASMSVHADMALKFVGTATGGDLSPLAAELMAETGVEVSDAFGCFELPILDLTSGNPVGIGVDCLNVFEPPVEAGLKIEALSFFFLPRGTLVNHGCTSVRPFWDGVGNSGVTHMTGSIGPAELGGENSPAEGTPCESTGGVIYATKGMKKFLDGETRLSGAVNLSNVGNGVITFSCLFVLND
jgi:hypothetical protein